jgi:hypothetical protein
MQVEHKLSVTVAAYAKRTIADLDRVRREYLIALGQAKELEFQATAQRLALSQQLAIVAEDSGLPRPLAPYQLSADGTALIGEIADVPAEAGAASINGTGQRG